MATALNLNAKYCSAPAFALSAPKDLTPAKAAGVRYDRKVGEFLRSWAGGNNYALVDHPWISYKDKFGRTLYCQPDYLLFSNSDDNLLVVEVKLRHTRECLGQLRTYKYMMQALHTDRYVCLIEVCRYFDCDELNIPLLPELRPHNHPVAAVIHEPGPLIAYDA